MAKTKNKSHNQLENTKGYIRELEKEIKSLRQQLRSYEKYERNISSQDTEYDSSSEDTRPNLKRTKHCDNCGKSKIVETLDLGKHGVFGRCDHCGFTGKM